MSVDFIPSVFLRQRLIWEDVAVHKTLSKRTYLIPVNKRPERLSISKFTYDVALKVGDSTGGLKKAWGNSRVLSFTCHNLEYPVVM
jgi:hypothetical protein